MCMTSFAISCNIFFWISMKKKLQHGGHHSYSFLLCQHFSTCYCCDHNNISACWIGQKCQSTVWNGLLVSECLYLRFKLMADMMRYLFLCWYQTDINIGLGHPYHKKTNLRQRLHQGLKDGASLCQILLFFSVIYKKKKKKHPREFMLAVNLYISQPLCSWSAAHFPGVKCIIERANWRGSQRPRGQPMAECSCVVSRPHSYSSPGIWPSKARRLTACSVPNDSM